MLYEGFHEDHWCIAEQLGCAVSIAACMIQTVVLHFVGGNAQAHSPLATMAVNYRTGLALGALMLLSTLQCAVSSTAASRAAKARRRQEAQKESQKEDLMKQVMTMQQQYVTADPATKESLKQQMKLSLMQIQQSLLEGKQTPGPQTAALQNVLQQLMAEVSKPPETVESAPSEMPPPQEAPSEEPQVPDAAAAPVDMLGMLSEDKVRRPDAVLL